MPRSKSPTKQKNYVDPLSILSSKTTMDSIRVSEEPSSPLLRHTTSNRPNTFSFSPYQPCESCAHPSSVGKPSTPIFFHFSFFFHPPPLPLSFTILITHQFIQPPIKMQPTFRECSPAVPSPVEPPKRTSPSTVQPNVNSSSPWYSQPPS